jgi:oxygen-independent coproporphyrinogen-3 oxidase
VNDLEVTLEANPTSVEAEKFAAFKEAGINRVSMGVQALDDAELKFLGRKHTLDEALAAISLAGDLFERFSFDLIYARPQQTLESWEAELRRAAMLAKGHLSLYQLTIERNTPFYFDHEQGKFQIPRDDLAADFYLLTQSVMRELGLPMYEVSNHASDEAQQSRHNLLYWHYGEYIGIGPGAHGRIELEGGRYAARDHHAPESWLKWVSEKGHGAHPYQLLGAEDQVLEALMMGLRLADGIGLENFTRFGAREWSDIVDMKQLRVFEGEGWLRADEARIALSDEGMLRLNALVPRLARERPRLDLMRFQGAA